MLQTYFESKYVNRFCISRALYFEQCRTTFRTSDTSTWYDLCIESVKGVVKPLSQTDSFFILEHNLLEIELNVAIQ